MSETKLTPRDSAKGENKHIHWCEPMEQKRFYSTCAHLVDAYNAKSLRPEGDSIHDDCAYAMERGRCPAVAMRKAEHEKGEAIYFKPSNAQFIASDKVDKNSISYKRGWNQVKGTKTQDFEIPIPTGRDAKPGTVNKSTSKTAPPKPEAEFAQPDYADLVTKMANEDAGVKKGEVSLMTAKSKVGKTAINSETQPATVDTNKPKQGESMLEMARRLKAAGGSQ